MPAEARAFSRAARRWAWARESSARMRWRWRAPESWFSSERFFSEASASRRIVGSERVGDLLLLLGAGVEGGLGPRHLGARHLQHLGGLLDLEGVLGDLLVDPVAAEVPLLLLDLRLLDAVAGGVDLGGGGEHLRAEAVDAGRDLLQVALGGGDLPLVLVDGGGGLVALAGQLAALLLEVLEDLAVGRDLGLAPLGEGPPLGRPLAELLHGRSGWP